MRLGLLALIVSLLGLPIGAPAQQAVPEDDSVRLVTVAGVTGSVATARRIDLGTVNTPKSWGSVPR